MKNKAHNNMHNMNFYEESCTSAARCVHGCVPVRARGPAGLARGGSPARPRATNRSHTMYA